MDKIDIAYRNLYRSMRWLTFSLTAALGACLGRGVQYWITESWDSVVWSGLLSVAIGVALVNVRFLRKSLDAKVLAVATELHAAVFAKAVADGIVDKMVDQGVTVLRDQEDG